jgi:hypothetical protein
MLTASGWMINVLSTAMDTYGALQMVDYVMLNTAHTSGSSSLHLYVKIGNQVWLSGWLKKQATSLISLLLDELPMTCCKVNLVMPIMKLKNVRCFGLGSASHARMLTTLECPSSMLQALELPDCDLVMMENSLGGINWVHCLRNMLSEKPLTVMPTCMYKHGSFIMKASSDAGIHDQQDWMDRHLPGLKSSDLFGVTNLIEGTHSLFIWYNLVHHNRALRTMLAM